MEEKRAKREIANMNERRRMKNINAGFHSLRALLPQKHDGEKLSKAAILQHTSTYIYQLEQEIAKLLAVNSELKRCVGGSAAAQVNTPEWVKRFASQPPDCPSCKRRKYENSHRLELDSSPNGGDGSSTESSSEQELNVKSRARSKSNGRTTDLRKELQRMQKMLDEERRIRKSLEDERFLQHGLSNGRQYPSGTADEVEVASESIEIEMHSCPASPPDVSEPQLATTTVFHHNQFNRIEVAHHQPNHQQQQQRVQKQNAIALPIDVPFVAPTELEAPNTNSTANTAKTTSSTPLMVFVDNNGVFSLIDSAKLQTNSSSLVDGGSGGGGTTQPQILQIVGSGTNSTTTKFITKNATVKGASPETAQKTSRQNLNKLVEAIRHLEGDHLFNEASAVAKLKQPAEGKTDVTTTTTTAADTNDTKTEPADEQANDPNVILSNMISGSVELASSRPQVIQRPNVIVANSMDN